MAAREVRSRATVLPSPKNYGKVRTCQLATVFGQRAARRSEVSHGSARGVLRRLASSEAAAVQQHSCPRTTATMSKVSSKSRSLRTPSFPSECASPFPAAAFLAVLRARRIAPGGESPRHLVPIAHVVSSSFPPQAERPRGGALHRGAQVRGRGVQGSRGDQRHHHQRCASLPSRVPRRAVHAHSALTRCPPRFTSPLLAQTASASTPARRAGTCSLSTAASFA